MSPLIVDFSLYLMLLASMFVIFAGYPLILAFIRWVRPRELHRRDIDLSVDDGSVVLPEITVVVPCFNEEAMIERKLDNLVGLRYPAARLHLLVVDGGSQDGTIPRIESFRTSHPDVDLVVFCSSRGGKIPQLNEALARIPEDHLVVVTDSDALVDTPDALLRTVSYFQENADVALVGGWTTPPMDNPRVLDAEYGHWDKQNRMRFLEALTHSASIVVAPYYAFWRRWFGQFPELCVADDVHISFQAHLDNRRIVYAHDIRIIEVRQPATLSQLFMHKFRKANAYSIELLRMLHLMPFMGKRTKVIYLFKVMQFFYLPWALIGFAFISLDLWLLGQHLWLMVGYFGLLFSIGLASLTIVAPPGHRRGGLRPRAIVATITLFSMTLVILCANVFVYPFWRQGSTYQRLGG